MYYAAGVHGALVKLGWADGPRNHITPYEQGVATRTLAATAPFAFPGVAGNALAGAAVNAGTMGAYNALTGGSFRDGAVDGAVVGGLFGGVGGLAGGFMRAAGPAAGLAGRGLAAAGSRLKTYMPALNRVGKYVPSGTAASGAVGAALDQDNPARGFAVGVGSNAAAHGAMRAGSWMAPAARHMFGSPSPALSGLGKTLGAGVVGMGSYDLANTAARSGVYRPTQVDTGNMPRTGFTDASLQLQDRVYPQGRPLGAWADADLSVGGPAQGTRRGPRGTVPPAAPRPMRPPITATARHTRTRQ